MENREERLGLNEALFRQVNERIAETSERFDLDQLEILCECARVGCVDRIELSALAYERARQSGTTFIVLLSHADSSIERIVFHGDSYAFVEKIGDAASVAEATDPR